MKSFIANIKQMSKSVANVFGFGADQSRIKKKLVLYFLLISIVSISVSIEIILEVSETPFREKLAQSFLTEFQTVYKDKTGEELTIPMEAINKKRAFHVLDDLRVRMLLLAAVVIGNIFTAFVLFSRDIARPIDALVEGAKKVSDGDLTAEVQVLTQDEIGELAKLINDMNVNLQELIMEIRFEMERLANKIGSVKEQLQGFNDASALDRAVTEKTMTLSSLRKMVDGHKIIEEVLSDMMLDLDSLTSLINMYKIYQVAHTSQGEN